MATARKLPSGKWRVRIYIKGHDPEYLSFTSDGTDRRAKTEIENQATEYKLSWEKKRKNPFDLTTGEAIDRYIENRSAVLSPATIRGYKYDRGHYLQRLMDIKLVDLTQDIVQIEINEEAKTHSPKTMRNVHGLLSAVLAEYLPDFRLRTNLPAPIKKVNQYAPEDDDIKKLLIATKGKRLQKAIILGACATLRRSEISALRPEDIDEKNNQIIVQRAVVLDDKKKWTFKGTKTYESARIVDVSPEVISALLDGAKPEEPLVGLVPDSITNLFCKVRNSLGIDMRFHDLRAYSASVQHALGVPDVYIMKQGGWSTDYVMKKIYRRAMEKRAKEASEITNKHFDGLLNTGDPSSI